ncbi:hypothetical protein F157LOC_00359 [Pectobacterium brasiliense]|uniref:acyl carrier protein n=1 Tax=Pectobacterium brasiliense TaxID=180957 RepID=UPI000CE68FF1|nr:acyl carrier protein [Pectobacterium brasiliense]PPE61534.1 hypothetical protein F157LOC_00359 [Pectobacterium brasiliense]
MIDKKKLTDTIISIANSLDDNFSLVSSAQDTFSKMAIDSLGFVKLLVGIEERYQFEFDERDLDLSKYHTIEDLITTTYKYVNI